MSLFFRKQKADGTESRDEPPPAVAGTGPATSSVLLAGTSVTGNVECEGEIVIDGAVRGSVRAMRLTVGPGGAIEGDISADEVTVKGSVKGPIHARHIHLEEGAQIEGDITTTTIAIDTGARLTGAVWQGGEAPQGEQRYQPITASSWESGQEGRSLLAARPRILGSGR